MLFYVSILTTLIINLFWKKKKARASRPTWFSSTLEE